MKRIIFALSLAAALTLTAAQNDMAEREKLAEALLGNLGVKQQINMNFAKIKALHYKVVNKILENAPKNEEVSKFKEKVFAISDDILSWDTLKKDFTKIYAEAYSLDELQKLNTFFSSPAGRTFIAKTPVLQRKLVSTLQGRIKEAKEKVRKMAHEFMTEQMLQGKTLMPAPRKKKSSADRQIIQL
ncbi:MAG: DUF2059 domain-containing protein [Victivallaceae bacterium]|nr:DUF2059 domain-containing protein [Victivallaceae bacterium]